MEKTLEPLLYYWNATRRSEEGFGDFCARIGFPGLEAYAEFFISPASSSSLSQVRVDTLLFRSLRGVQRALRAGGLGPKTCPWNTCKSFFVRV